MNTLAGQLWVIEGGDGVGKATQADLLRERLLNSSFLRNQTVHAWSFPKYDAKPWGPLVRQYLDGRFGTLEQVDPYFAALLYAADREREAEAMKSVLTSGDWIVCDRFVMSNMAHQSSRISNFIEQEKFISWLEDLEYELFNIPHAHGVIVLTLPPEITKKRADERRRVATESGQNSGKVAKTDIHEQSLDHLAKAHQQYHKLADKYGWHKINCYDDGIELSRAEIADKIWEIIEPNLK